MRDLGLARNNGSVVCQVCGIYFTPDSDLKVCPQCRKTKKHVYPNSNLHPNPWTALMPKSVGGVIISFILLIIVLFALGGISL